jgi:hypothetical protein
MVLKAACMHNNCYIDRLITPFMKVLHHMTRDHLSQSVAETNPGERLDSFCDMNNTDIPSSVLVFYYINAAKYGVFV